MSRYAYRLGLVDIPNDRSSHTLPTPRGGGVGILLAFLAAGIASGATPSYWLPAVFISLVSFFDDKLGLTPKIRLLFQFVGAYATVLPWILHQSMHSPSKVALLVFFPIFIVGTANFYNFMDGINGIAGLTGLVGFLLLYRFATTNGYDNQALLILATGCACLGFIPFNLPTARVFMGDVGSILLGFFFAVTVTTLSRTIVEFLALSGCLFTFYADALSTLFVRWRVGEKLSQAHRRHLYQLLANQKQLPHWQVTLSYAVIQVAVGLSSLQLMSAGGAILCLFLGAAFCIWCLVMVSVRRVTEIRR
jgi:Fuc2NAc and GlcNAc transferase